MIALGAQYYRAPFPDAKYWEKDFKDMAASGLNTAQLWVKWAWVEPEPGRFRFDDYDRLVELAGEKGLKVVLSAIAEIQPYWIHRVAPGSEMVDNTGRRVVSSNRVECHFGLTPGGCFDHPAVWERMCLFLRTVAARYRSAPNLYGWDIWNELRWNVQADGFVCYCTHTLSRFRRWLDQRHGGLDGLNRAWNRRYGSWEDVLPGKMPRSPYTEMTAFEHFLTWRSCEHGRMRYELIKAVDPAHPATLHGGSPSPIQCGGFPDSSPQDRGNDWFFADAIDGVGTSSFPHWGNMDLCHYSARLQYTASAARGKLIWLSELQGGRAATGFSVHTPVRPADQQRWIWTGLSKGASAILFWCWRDEVFGCESAGFGLSGRDGHAGERLEAMRKTGALLEKHGNVLEQFRPDRPQAGVYFSPQAYYVNWIEDKKGDRAMNALQGYARALTRVNVPFLAVEEEHLEELKGLKILFMPRSLVLDRPQEQALSAWVKAGGTLVCESECGAFGSNGIYRYPEDRFLADLCGASEIGRRTLSGSAVTIKFHGKKLRLPATQWLTPFSVKDGEVLGTVEDGPIVLSAPAGKGRVVLCGTYPGEAYFAGSFKKEKAFLPCGPDFERFVLGLALRAGVARSAEPVLKARDKNAFIDLRGGWAGNKRLWFVLTDTHAKGVELSVRDENMPAGALDIISGRRLAMTKTGAGLSCRLPASEWGVWVLLGQ